MQKFNIISKILKLCRKYSIQKNGEKTKEKCTQV